MPNTAAAIAAAAAADLPAAPVPGRTRRGSVMIMVVALLVLLAIMGTAYLATSRADRATSIQSNATQQVEHEVNGVIAKLQQTLLDDLHGRAETEWIDPSTLAGRNQVPRYVPGGMNNAIDFTDLRAAGPYSILGPQISAAWYELGGFDFEHYDGPARIVVPILDANGRPVDEDPKDRVADTVLHEPDPWLADRIPSFLTGPDDLPYNRYAWRWVSAPFSGIRGMDNFWEFDNPYGTSFYAPRKSIFPDVDPATGEPLLAWEVNPGNSMELEVAPAADTDGDGIADAFFSKLPGSTTNGLTTYVAWRIVDNAAAVNAAIAFQHKRTSTGNRSGATTGLNFFPVNIGLADPIGPGDSNPNRPRTSLVSRDGEIQELQEFRTSDPNANPAPASFNPPIDDFGNARNDFQFEDAYDAMWHQLGRRPELPAPGYFRIPPADTLALAHGFVVGTPGVTGNSTIERLLNLRAGNPPLWQRYTPANLRDITDLWGDNNFADRPTSAQANAPAHEAGINPPFFNPRPLLVTSNPVSQAAPVYLSRPWFDAWGFEHRVPFHPEYRNATPTFNETPMPDMLDYDLASRYVGYWQEGTEYAPGDIVRVDNRTYLCVATKNNALFPGLPGNADIDPSNLHLPSGTAAVEASVYWEYQPYTPVPMKASLNTAPFRELYRAFWSVMCNPQDPDLHPLTLPPFNEIPSNLRNRNFSNFNFLSARNVRETEDTYAWENAYSTASLNESDNFGQMFRSSIRDNSSSGLQIRFNGRNQALLRAALASINTIDLRDSESDAVTPEVSSRTVTLEMENRSGGFVPVTVDVYGNERQPFITRVFLSGGKKAQNPNGFVLIELFNPYQQTIRMRGWKILLVERPSSGQRPKLSSTRRSLDIPDRDIPAGEYLFLTNLNAGGTGPATVDPSDLVRPTREPTAGHDWWCRIANLHAVEDREFIIVRPRVNGSPGTSVTPSGKRVHYNDYNENNLTDMVPVDQHDLTKIRMHDNQNTPDEADDTAIAYYYWRQHDNGANRFRCVYPGRYYPDKSGTYPATRHEDAVWVEALVATQSDGPSVATDADVPVGVDIGTGTDSSSDDDADQFPPIQLNNEDFAGPNETTTNTGNAYPFGGFARVGDVLQVPFIGAYRIREASADADEFVEMNSISMDSAFVSDRDSHIDNNRRENLGRFCPIPEDPSVSHSTKFSYYDWAKDIFDHFTVIAPYDDYFPNVVGGPPVKGMVANYPAFTTSNPPYHVAAKFIPNTTVHDQPSEQAVEGLININTAPWRVLATVPWTAGNGAAADNYNIAKSIVRHRELNGPFKSIADLQNVEITTVPGVSAGSVAPNSRFWLMPPGFDDYDDDQGDISPQGLGQRDGVAGGLTDGDFEHQFLMLNRVSNLITTRSDSFTAYICLQQWENAGTPDARMVSQRRYAVLLDRSGIVKDKKDVKVSYIPID